MQQMPQPDQHWAHRAISQEHRDRNHQSWLIVYINVKILQMSVFVVRCHKFTKFFAYIKKKALSLHRFFKHIGHGVVLEWLKRHAWKACNRHKRFPSSNLGHSALCTISPYFFLFFIILYFYFFLPQFLKTASGFLFFLFYFSSPPPLKPTYLILVIS